MKNRSPLSLRQLLQSENELMHQILEQAESDASEDKQELLEIIRGLLVQKPDDVAAQIMDVLPTHITALKARAKLYADAARAADRSLESLKNYAQFVMEEQGIDKLDGGELSLKLVKNSQPSVTTDDTDIHRYANTDMVITKIEYAWDKTKLKEMAADDPESLPAGVRVVRGKHVRVSIRKK
jgi:DNA-directed RNA polymerase subunit F